MTTPDPNEDPVEWILLDTDLITVLAILPAVDGRLYLERNEAGSGSLKVYSLGSVAELIGFNQFVLCKYRGAIRGGFFIDNINETSVSQGEGTDLWTEISGRGALAFLSQAIIPSFGTSPTVATAVTTKGNIIRTGLVLAKARGCFPVVTWDFGNILDSASVAWVDTESMEFTVGKNYLEILRTFVGMGVHFDVSINYSSAPTPANPAIPDGTPMGFLLEMTYTGEPGTPEGPPSVAEFVLHAYKDVRGTDKSDTLFLRRGVNVIEASKQVSGVDLVNAVTAKYGFGDSVGYVTVEDATSISTYGRHEVMIDATDTNTLLSATAFANAELAKLKDPQQETVLKVIDQALTTRVFLDYDIGDIVTYDASGTETTLERISSLLLEWIGDNEKAQVSIGFGNPIYDKDTKTARDVHDLKEMKPRIGNVATGGGGAGGIPPTWVIRLPAIGGVAGPRISADVTAVRIDAFTEEGTSVAFNVELRSSVGGAGTNLMTSDLTATSAGESDTTLATTALTAESWLYLDISAVSGDVGMLCVVVTTS